jgi:hypothetical protein
VKAITRGGRGAGIVSARCGQPGKLPDGTPHYPALAAALPSLMSEQERRALPRRSVPDIVTGITDAKNRTRGDSLVELKYCRIHLVEVKYYRKKTPPRPQKNQHAALMQAIVPSNTAPPGRSVVLHKFTLEVGG